MICEQSHWTPNDGWTSHRGEPLGRPANLVLVFGDRTALCESNALADLRARHPGAALVGCSSAGDILDTCILDGGIVATAVAFEYTTVRVVNRQLIDGNSYVVGFDLAKSLMAPDLRHVFVLSDGLHVNGSELVRGLAEGLPPETRVTGGLSADGASFAHTVVLADGEPVENKVCAVGFYGRRLQARCGSQGGWDQFGPTRVITRSEGNVLYELDGEPALDVYRRYLGEHAADLPASGLRFPLSVRPPGHEREIVRTLLAVDAAAGSVTFAGDMPRGAQARLMKASFERLIDGATEAAEATGPDAEAPAQLAILISCVGRKLLLGQRTEEEVEAVRSTLGVRPALAGFYSYGEVSPFTVGARCELHNQTMTITTLVEA